MLSDKTSPADQCYQRKVVLQEYLVISPVVNRLISLQDLRAVAIKHLVELSVERYFWPHVFIEPACSRVRYRRPIFRPSVRPSVRLSTFMSTFDIYVKVSILINYKTKQPSNLA